MLIEAQIENTIANYIRSTLSAEYPNVEVRESWQPAEEGHVKAANSNSSGIVSIFVMPRIHDNFSLPTVNVQGIISIEIKAEHSPTMAMLSNVYEKISDMMDFWHYNGQQFSQYISSKNFYASELKLDGGDKISFNQATACWEMSIQFTIRGSIATI